MLIIQRTASGPDRHWYVCRLKTCSRVEVGELNNDQIKIPVGWCIARQPSDPIQMAVLPVYCCPEHALEDDGRTAHDRDGNEVEFPQPVDLVMVRRPLDDVGLKFPRGGA